MMYLTGAYPDRDVARDRDRIDYDFARTTSPAKLVHPGSENEFWQTIPAIRRQPKFPNCVGQTFAACIDASIDSRLPSDPDVSSVPKRGEQHASGVSIWREARRRQGLIEQIEFGTRFEYAVDGLVARGWDAYRDGEDTDEEEAGVGAAPAGDDLADEMEAFDNRVGKPLARYRIFGVGSGVLDAVDEALRRGDNWGVAIGTFLAEPFFLHVGDPNGIDVTLGWEFFSGFKNAHAQRICGRALGYGNRRKYLLQNSHGVARGGAHLPDGTWQPGCNWVDESVIVGANDIHVIQLKV
jgi:hypothetical protein